MSDPSMGPTDGHGSNKRKREGSDSAGPDHQRLNRSSHGSNGSAHTPEAQTNFPHGGIGYEHGLPNAAADLNIDQQILQHVGTQNGITDENALSTAKAALAAHTPQNKYPPPPEGFDTSNLAHGLSFGDDMGQAGMGGSHGQNSTAAAVYAAREAQNINQKPNVGSPEWHQVRKNNHKEGILMSPIIEAILIKQLSAAAVSRSTRASTSLLVSCPTATRTREPSCSAPSSTLLI